MRGKILAFQVKRRTPADKEEVSSRIELVDAL